MPNLVLVTDLSGAAYHPAFEGVKALPGITSSPHNL